MNETVETQFSAYASLVALGLRFQKLRLWSPVKEHVQVKQKVRQHTPLDKLLDCFINILAGGAGLVEINTRVRPDRVLQLAFGRTACAEQSTISDTLNACSAENVLQMRMALQCILRAHGQSYRHEYEQSWQVLDVDMTGLPAGRHGEGVTSGYFARQRSRRGRQLGRVVATLYDELVVERLYDGRRVLHRSLAELVTGAEEVLELAENKRQSTIIRLDAGGGEDEDINWVLQRGYQVLVKVKNWRRAQKLAASVNEWYPDSKVVGREVGWVARPHAYGRATRQLAVRHRKANGEWSFHVLVFTLTDQMLCSLAGQTIPARSPSADVLFLALHAYDRRGGGVETQNRGDKQGLGLGHRNKQRFAAQEMLVLLGQLAHNLVIWTRNDLARVDPRLHKYGVQRTVRDVLHIAGRLEVNADGQVRQIVLNEKHPLAAAFHNAFAE